MMNEYKVSIVMPCYNASDTIVDSIQSCLRQTHLNFELLIVDDGSTDNSVLLIQSYVDVDSRVILLKNRYGKGAAGARQTAIDASSGRFISFLDSDDLWLEFKLEKQIEYMIKHDVGFSFSNYQIFSSKDSIHKNLPLFSAPLVVNYDNLLKNCPIGCLTVMLDKNKFEHIVIPPIPKEDYACWLRLLRNGTRAHNIGLTTALYRKGNSSLSSNKFTEISKQWFVIRYAENSGFLKSIQCITNYCFSGLIKHLYSYSKWSPDSSSE